MKVNKKLFWYTFWTAGIGSFLNAISYINTWFGGEAIEGLEVFGGFLISLGFLFLCIIAFNSKE